LVVVSPAGGTAPLDPASVEMFKNDASSILFLDNHKNLWENTAKLSTYAGRVDEFDAVFVPGGHGPMFDLAVDSISQQLIAEFAAKGKVVSAVCHGPAAFVNVQLPESGEYLLKNKSVTGFSNVEEDQVKLSDIMPFLLEDRLNEVSGGNFVKADEPWGAKVVVDGNIITGQNPASARSVGEAILNAIAM
jgi:putative intracellular protease/amidase